MNNQSKQVIPDSQSIVRFQDREVVNALGSHSTFAISELLKILSAEEECLDINVSSFPFRSELAKLVNQYLRKEALKTIF